MNNRPVRFESTLIGKVIRTEPDVWCHFVNEVTGDKHEEALAHTPDILNLLTTGDEFRLEAVMTITKL